MDRCRRFYLTPGFGHGHGVFDADSTCRIADWTAASFRKPSLDNNKRPGEKRPESARSRDASNPFAGVQGSGDVGAANSLVCATE